ncbi:peptidase C39 family protein [Microbacterium sp. NPDC055903]
MPRTLVLSYAPDAVPEAATVLFDADTIARWASADRSARRPEVIAIEEEGAWLAAALVTARAGAAYLKIVDAAGELAPLIEAIAEHAIARGAVQLKWEGWTTDHAQASEHGFAPLQTPLDSAIGDDEPERGYVRWLVEADLVEPPYYRQTETFTCGAVVSLMARALGGDSAARRFDRAAELAFWRSATNFPACEPVGLGVAVRRTWPDAAVEVALDTDRSVMIGHLPPAEQQWRAVLQRESRADAAAAGVAVRPRRMPVDEMRAVVEAGERMLVAVSLRTMQGFDVPHWLLCHAAVRGALIAEDPWTSGATGDTWLDAHLLPIADSSLDEMAALEEDGYRGVVRIG